MIMGLLIRIRETMAPAMPAAEPADAAELDVGRPRDAFAEPLSKALDDPARVVSESPRSGPRAGELRRGGLQPTACTTERPPGTATSRRAS